MFYENDTIISPEVLSNFVFIMDDVIGEQQNIIRHYLS